jgi:hypothetical protein
VLLASESREADAAAKTTLFDLLGLVREIEARGWEPIIRTELAEVARRSGDEEARDRELREAERLYTEMSGTSQTERVEGKPAPAR